MQAPSKEHLYKLLVIGDLGVGKTSIIKRYVHQNFSSHYRATIGVDFALKVLHWDPDTVVRLQLWDIAGEPRGRGPGAGAPRRRPPIPGQQVAAKGTGGSRGVGGTAPNETLLVDRKLGFHEKTVSRPGGNFQRIPWSVGLCFKSLLHPSVGPLPSTDLPRDAEGAPAAGAFGSRPPAPGRGTNDPAGDAS